MGEPVATIAFYGPDDTRASKLVVTVLISPEDEHKDVEIHEQKTWFSETADRRDRFAGLRRNGAQTDKERRVRALMLARLAAERAGR